MASSLSFGTLNPCANSSKPPSTVFRNRFPIRSRLRLLKLPNNNAQPQQKHALAYSSPSSITVHKSLLPLAAAVAVILCSGPANAGLLSGFPGIESVPGPQLPEIDFLTRFNEENQKKYAENDARFKESPLLKKLLEKTQMNKEKNRQAILDKYCIRGAEWGVGDCSTAAMSPEERESFISMLKQKAGME